MPPTKKNKNKNTKKNAQLEAAQKLKEEEEEAQKLEALKEEEELKAKEKAQRLQELAKKRQIVYETETRSRSELESERHNLYCFEKQALDIEAEWVDYIACDDSIRAANVKDVNTFITTSTSKDEHHSLSKFDEFCCKLYPLLDDIQIMKLDLASTNRTLDAELEASQRCLLNLAENKVEDCTNWFMATCIQNNDGGCKENIAEYNGSRSWIGRHIGIALPTNGVDTYDLSISGCRACADFEQDIFRIVRLPRRYRGFNDYFTLDGMPYFILGNVYSVGFLAIQPLSTQVHDTIDLAVTVTVTMNVPSWADSKRLQVVRLLDESYTQEGISHVTMDESQHLLTFLLHQRRSTVALVYRHTTLKKWSLQPSHAVGINAKDSVLLTLESETQSSIIVSCKGCSVFSSKESDSLVSIDEVQEVSPGKLIHTFWKNGVHFFGQQDWGAHEDVEGLTLFNAPLEKIETVLYPDLSMLATSFEISSSRDSTCICELRDSNPCIGAAFMTDALVIDVDNPNVEVNMVDNCEHYIRWSLCKGTGMKDASEDSNFLDSDFHVYPMYCLQKYHGMEKMKAASPVLTGNICRLLNLIRPLMICKPKRIGPLIDPHAASA